MVRRCWNCGRSLETVRSEATGIEYCVVCGAGTDELDAIAATKKISALAPPPRPIEGREPDPGK